MNVFSVLAAAASLIVIAGSARAQAPDYLTQNRAAVRAADPQRNTNGVAANGRCGGMSYGTGARSCGTATGGPAGGDDSRN